jgi:hypothetical protein
LAILGGGWSYFLTRREEALVAREEKAKISEKALIKVSADLDTKREKAEATRKHSLDLDNMLGEKKVELNR